MNTILEAPSDGQLCLAISKAGFDDIRYIISLQDQDIDNLTFGEKKEQQFLNTQNQSYLRVFRDYVKYKESISEPVGLWTSISQSEYNYYRSGLNFPFITTEFTTSSQSKPSSIHPNSRPINYLQEFCKGIKRDASLYPSLQDMRTWDSWQGGIKAIARAQDVEDILDPLFSPRTKEAKDLFEEKQKFMFAVFEQTLLTDKAKEILRSHEQDYDAQEVY